MRDESEFHPEFLRTWPDRYAEWLRFLSSRDEQRAVWLDKSKQYQGISDFEDFAECHDFGLFVSDFNRHFASTLRADVKSASDRAVSMVLDFQNSMTRDQGFEIHTWFDSERWAACVEAGRLASHLINSHGWFRTQSTSSDSHELVPDE
jgi:hypothetical protein